MSERIPPHDDGAERVVLGAAMLHRDAAGRATELRTADFYRPAHASIFAAIADAVAAGEPADALAIAARMDAGGALARAGGAPYLHELIAAVPVAANVGWYARIVAERAAMRRITEAGARIHEIGYDLERDPDEAAALAARTLAEASEVRSSSGPVPMGELLAPALAAIETAAAAGDIPGLATGVGVLDKATGGLRPGNMITIAGRPGMGKSVLAAQLATHAARYGHRALLASLEMTKGELVHRILAADTGIDLRAISNGSLAQHQWDQLAAAAGRLESIPLFIDDTAPLTLPDIAARARRLHAAEPLSLIVVDYLQLIRGTGRADNRHLEIAAIATGLKLLAKELAVPVVAAAQLNRGVEMRADKRPHLSDLRESGSIEESSDIVITLFRPGYYDPKTDRGDELELTLAKNRHGPTGTLTAYAEYACARIVDAEARKAAYAARMNGARA